MKKQFRNAVGIFILPPSLDALEERLEEARLDEPKVITRRLLAAGSEIAHAPEAEYVVINENFERALAELRMHRRGHAPALCFAVRATHGAVHRAGIHLPHAE